MVYELITAILFITVLMKLGKRQIQYENKASQCNLLDNVIYSPLCSLGPLELDFDFEDDYMDSVEKEE